MIIFNRDRFFGGGRCGAIRAASFRCALITVSTSAMVSTFVGEWDSKNYEPVAEAHFPEALSRQQMRQVHDQFLDQLNRCGIDDVDLWAAIEQVFGQARQKKIVHHYQNNAGILLAPATNAQASSPGTLEATGVASSKTEHKQARRLWHFW